MVWFLWGSGARPWRREVARGCWLWRRGAEVQPGAAGRESAEAASSTDESKAIRMESFEQMGPRAVDVALTAREDRRGAASMANGPLGGQWGVSLSGQMSGCTVAPVRRLSFRGPSW